MSLWGTLNIARTSLATTAAALQTVGNNIANSGDENYSRQVTNVSPNEPQSIRPGIFVGTGVDIDSVERQVDDSIDQRLRASNSDSSGATAGSQWLSRLESTYNELSDSDLSTGMSTFFNSWSELANKPQDSGLRQVVVQDGTALSSQFQSMRNSIVGLRSDLNDSITNYTTQADDLASKVADLNKQIAKAEAGGGMANSLRDTRDGDLKDLSALVNITVSHGDNGMVNVYVGSEPLVMNGQSQGLTLRKDADPTTGDVTQTLIFKADGGTVPVTSGILGATKDAQATIQAALDHTDKLASSIIYELNKLHGAGQGTSGFSSVTSENAVADPTARLDSKAADLDFAPTNGSFVVQVKDKTTGAITSTLIPVNLTNPDGTTGTTLNSLRDAIANVGGVGATINAGKLTVAADSSAVEVSFSQDSSGVLASLGINNFFSGSDARDIAVSKTVANDTSKIAAAANGQPADNTTAKAIAALQDKTLAELGGQSLVSSYQAQVTSVGSKVDAANQSAAAAGVVLSTMTTQRDAVSGVNLDEEAITMMRYQRAYQASSRVVAATDDMLKQIIALV